MGRARCRRPGQIPRDGKGLFGRSGEERGDKAVQEFENGAAESDGRLFQAGGKDGGGEGKSEAKE